VLGRSVLAIARGAAEYRPEIAAEIERLLEDS